MTLQDVITLSTPQGDKVEVHTHLFINNEFVPAHGPSFDLESPITEEHLCSLKAADEADVNLAVKAAKDAYRSVWRKTPHTERARLMVRLAELIVRDAQQIATITTLSNGKTLISALYTDAYASAQCIRYFAGWADKIHGKIVDTGLDKLSYTRHEPLGVIGSVIPWNYPILMGILKIAAALAAGNTVVLKSSEITPLPMYKFAELTKEAGFPPGVLNIISGPGTTTGSYLTNHPDITKMMFTGSVATGRKIAQASAESNLKRIQLELGGKSAQIVCADADLTKSARIACTGVFQNQGQNCFAGSRILVHEDIYDAFLALFLAETQKIVLGNPFLPETQQGPQINKLQFEKVLGYIRLAQEEGATLYYGGKRWGQKGYYIEPTIFTDCKNNMRFMQEEIFGPVVGFIKFKTLAEAIEIANDTLYGLGGAVYTKDLNTALSVVDAVDAGTMWVNCYGQLAMNLPFGGFKLSGCGKDLSKYAIEEYTRVKAVQIQRDSSI